MPLVDFQLATEPKKKIKNKRRRRDSTCLPVRSYIHSYILMYVFM